MQQEEEEEEHRGKDETAATWLGLVQAGDVARR